MNENLIYINARSVLCNLNHIELICKKLNPLIVFCSEARVTDEISDEIKIDGYNVFICTSKSRFTGGIAIYVKNNIKVKTVFMNSIDKTLWCLAIEIINSQLNGIFSCFYRANNAKSKLFEDSFDEFLAKTIDQNKLCICVGDLNLNMNEKTTSVKQFTDTYEMHGLKYVSDFFTRIAQNSKTKIDVVLTNANERVNCQALPNEKITDHETIRINVANAEKIIYKKQTVISWKNYNKIDLIENLRKTKWHDFDKMDVNEMIQLMRKNLESAAKPMIKDVVIKTNTNSKTWFDGQLMALKNERNEKYFKFACYKHPENWKKYVVARNIYNDMIKSKKDKSIRIELIKANKNQRLMWKNLNKMLPKKKNQITGCEIKFESGATSNENEISNNFNKFFIESIVQINAQIPNDNTVTEQIVPHNFFKFRKVNVEQLCAITKHLTKKINKSQICNSMVWNDAIEYVGHHFCSIINKSFEEGIFPDCWKIATVIPIPKIKNSNKCEEFRPINTMPNDEKIIECVVNNN